MSSTRRVAVTVKPGSKAPGIDASGETLVVRMRERAVEGAANAAVIRALAGHFAVAPSCVVLVHGAHSRAKLFDIELPANRERAALGDR